MAASPSSIAIETQYRPDLEVLITRWLHPVSDEELLAGYDAVLAAAQAHDNCRYWLFDMRRRRLGGDKVNEALSDHFFSRLPQAVGGPVCIAYLATPMHLANIVLGNTEEIRKAVRQYGTRTHFFADEAPALSWLAGHRATNG